MAKVGRKPGRPRADLTEVPTAEKILAAASKLFMELGYDGVSTDDVASETGVTKAMIYYYYASKAELFTASIVRMMKNICKRTQEILEEPQPLYHCLLKITSIRLNLPGPRYDFNTILRNTDHVLTQKQLAEIHDAEHALMDVLTQAFSAGITAGELRDIDPMTVSYLYVHSLSAAEHRSSRDSGHNTPDVDALAKQIVDVLFYGVAKPTS